MSETGKDGADDREISRLRIAIVGTGAIGGAVARAFDGIGAELGLIYRTNSTEAEAIAALVRSASRKAVAIACDVTDPDDANRALRTIHEVLGGLDVVISATGAPAAWTSVAELDPKAWANFLAVDLTGTFHVFRAAVPLLRERGGAIVTISSIAASLFPIRNAQAAAAKAGVEALVRVLAREEGRHGIRVNAIAIGLTDSPAADLAMMKWGPDTARRVVSAIPLGRIGTHQEVADAVVFLAGPQGRYVTGQVVCVDGGQYIGH